MVDEKQKACYVFLLSDAFIICSPEKKQKYKYGRTLTFIQILRMITVIHLTPQTVKVELSDIGTQFVIQTRKRPFIFAASHRQERDAWVSAVSTLLLGNLRLLNISGNPNFSIFFSSIFFKLKF